MVPTCDFLPDDRTGANVKVVLAVTAVIVFAGVLLGSAIAIVDLLGNYIHDSL